VPPPSIDGHTAAFVHDVAEGDAPAEFVETHVVWSGSSSGSQSLNLTPPGRETERESSRRCGNEHRKPRWVG
jgi:hypothetical protein